MLLSELDILVYTSIHTVYTLFTTTLHLESGSIRLALQTSLNCTLVAFIPVSLLLSAVSSTDRSPRRGLPRPNCYSHGLTS